MVFSASADAASCQLSSTPRLLTRSPSEPGSPRSSLKSKGANAAASWGRSVEVVEEGEPVRAAGPDGVGCDGAGGDGAGGDGAGGDAAAEGRGSSAGSG